MALPTGYNVFPLFKNPNDKVDLRCVHRKIAKSYGLALSLIERDIWEDVTTKITDRITARAELQNSPEFDGIVEGIVQVNPWILELDVSITVEITCRFTYYGTDIDRFDFENDIDVFKASEKLFPNQCERVDLHCLKYPPENMHQYSEKLKALYKKYGGPIGTRYEKSEMIDVTGSVPPFKQHRFKETCLRRTECLLATDTPEDPYVFINMPFRFNIKNQPDSTVIKHDPKMDYLGIRNPPNREQLHYDARHGFQEHFLPSDGISTSDSDDKECRHRHPGEVVYRKKKNKVREILRTDQRDLMHKDSYNWRQRPKKPVQHGIRWYVRAFVTKTADGRPMDKLKCTLKIRKQSYSPIMGLYREILPKTKYTDYCLAKVPEIGLDSGVITLVGRTNKKAYALGDDVFVEVKVHNRSTRVIQRLIIEVVQIIQMKFVSGRVWRNTVCKRICDCEKDDKFLPILPGTQDVLINTVLHPWPTLEQANQMKCNLKNFEPKLRFQEIESWHVKKNKTTDPSTHLAEIPLARHHPVPPPTFIYRHLTMSTVDCEFKILINDMEVPPKDPAVNPCIWNGQPYPPCRCYYERNDYGNRNDHNPPLEPYPYYIEFMDLANEINDRDREYAKDFERHHQQQVFCRRKFPVKVSYEVLIRAELAKQNQHDYYHAETMRQRECKTDTTGLVVDPEGYQRGIFGPQLVLPIVYLHQLPLEKIPEPVGNFRVQQRQFWNTVLLPKPQVWEPSTGRGTLISNPKPVADCIPFYKDNQ